MTGGLGGFRIVPADQANSQVEDIDALFLLKGLRIVPDVEQAFLQTFGGQPCLQLGVQVARGTAFGVPGIIAGLRDAAGIAVVGVEGGAFLRRQLHAGLEGQALAFAQKAEDLGGLFIDDLDGADIARAQGDVEQAVARRQVEQRVPFFQQAFFDRHQ